MDLQQQNARVAQPRRGGGFSAQSSFLFHLMVILFVLEVCLHQVPEGHAGVYWRGDTLLKTVTYPGVHLKLPMIYFEPIQVTLQTHQFCDIPCGTKDDVMINIEKIEVVNRLRKEYVYETLRSYGTQYYCSYTCVVVRREISKLCGSHSIEEVFDQIDEKLREALHDDSVHYASGIEIISVRVTRPTIPDSVRRGTHQGTKTVWETCEN